MTLLETEVQVTESTDIPEDEENAAIAERREIEYNKTKEATAE